jgi:hypothetical protein
MAFGPSPDHPGTVLYVAGQEAGMQVVYKDGGTFQAEPFAEGLVVDGTLLQPRALALSPGGGFGDDRLYVGDWTWGRLVSMPLSGAWAEEIAEFQAGYDLRDIAFWGDGTLALTSAAENAVVGIEPAAAPEPSLCALMAALLVGLCARRRAG